MTSIIIDLDMRLYAELNKIAKSKGFKLKPFCELILRRYQKEESVSPRHD